MESFFGVATSFVSTGSWLCVYVVGRFIHIFLDLVLELQTCRPSTACDWKVFSPFRVLIYIGVPPPPIFNFFTRYSLTRGSLAAVIKHWKSFHFSTEILMLHCYWNNTHTDHTSSLVNGSIAEIFCFCGSIWYLSFFLFPIIIFCWWLVLLFVLITLKGSWVIVLTFFTYNFLGTCLCWMVTWDRIIERKTEFVFGQLPASLIHTELQKFRTIIHIMIFLTNMT